jgi:hypothetical protein
MRNRSREEKERLFGEAEKLVNALSFSPNAMSG